MILKTHLRESIVIVYQCKEKVSCMQSGVGLVSHSTPTTYSQSQHKAVFLNQLIKKLKEWIVSNFLKKAFVLVRQQFGDSCSPALVLFPV